MKYYKLIENDQIVGVITSNNFVKYSPITDCYLGATDLNGEYAYYKNQLYRSTWMQPIVQSTPYKEVLIIAISKEEYDVFMEALKANEAIDNSKTEEELEEEAIEQEINKPIDPIDAISIDFIRASKITEMSFYCRTTIESGIDFNIRGETKHFSLTTQDQLNLMSAQTMAQTQTLIPYHADGEETDFYTNEEINQLAEAAAAFKVQHTTYYNSLKTYINALETIEEISAITYGVEIPDEYKSDVLKVLEQ